MSILASESNTSVTLTAPETALTPINRLNSQQNTWLLPDGVVDLLSDEAAKQEALRYQLTGLLVSHGYQLISPPMIEYTESLLNHATEDLKRQTFKIIDQLTGRLMGVRADITPQIARIDAYAHQKSSKPNHVARYCYSGHVIYTLPKGLFGSRTPLQLGAEIFGLDTLAADIELLDVLCILLDSTDLVEQSHIDIGHVAIFQTLSELANLSDELQQQFIELYANKALPDLEALSQSLNEAGVTHANDFYVIGRYSNDLSKLQEQLSDAAKNHPTITQALSDLATLVQHLQAKQMSVSIDITELKSYHYHTGMVFNVYVGNESLPMVRGGRFDNPHSDTPRPATGFSCDLSRWQDHIQVHAKPMTVLPYQLAQQVLHTPNHPDADSLHEAIAALREEGHRVIIALAEHDEPTDTTHYLQVANGVWYLRSLNDSNSEEA